MRELIILKISTLRTLSTSTSTGKTNTRSRGMSERQTQARKHFKNAHEHENTEKNNELSYRRGQNPQISPADMAIRREKQRLRTSSGRLRPSCTDFGPDRNTMYPGYFFCKGCIEWDNRPIENRRIKKINQRYRCTAEHTSFIHPTHKLKGWYKNMSNKDVENLLSDEENETNLSTDTTINTPNLTTTTYTSTLSTSVAQGTDKDSTLASEKGENDDTHEMESEIKYLREEIEKLRVKSCNEILEL